MEAKDWIAVCAIGIALGSFVVAFVALRRTTGHNATIRQYASAAPETAVLGQINQARARVADIALRLQDITKGRLPTALNADEKRHIRGMEGIYHEAAEVLLNTYELACGMYRDGKLDRERFRRQYGEEIRKLFDGASAYKERLQPVSSPFKAIRAVYEEWFNPEK